MKVYNSTGGPLPISTSSIGGNEWAEVDGTDPLVKCLIQDGHLIVVTNSLKPVVKRNPKFIMPDPSFANATTYEPESTQPGAAVASSGTTEGE